MGKSKIDWLARPGTVPWSWNLVGGCTKQGAGCENCYAITFAKRLQSNPSAPKRYIGTVKRDVNGGLDWTGQVNIDLEAAEKALGWKKERTVFVCSMSDFYHWRVSRWFQLQVFGIMAALPEQTFIMLTKRPGQAALMFKRLNGCEIQFFRDTVLEHGMQARVVKVATDLRYPGPEWPLPNVWGLVSASTQDEVEMRLPVLAELPYAVRGLSYEPMLEPLDLSKPYRKSQGSGADVPLAEILDWLVIGCESGPSARLSLHGDPITSWAGWQAEAQALVEQAHYHGIPVYVKQIPVNRWGGDGWVMSREQHEWPQELQVREWPR